MTVGALEEFKLDSIYILQTSFTSGGTKRGTCFSIEQDLLLTANHVVKDATSVKVFLTSDSFAEGQHIEAECIYSNVDLDVAVLKLPDGTTTSSLGLYATSVNLDSDVKSCGYPVEKEHYPAPIKVKVTNTFEHMTSREYSFEVSQSDTVSKYSGMSGSPVIHDGRCLGILLVQQGGNTLYAVSAKDFLGDASLKKIVYDHGVEITVQEGIGYKAPDFPASPFKYCINCNVGLPNIKGIDIGFTMEWWNISDFTETVYDWIIDYCLSHKQKANFTGGSRSLFKYARSHYPTDDLNALGDLCLHIAIRESYSTIPVMNKVFDVNNKTFSCTHAVLNFDSIELWIGASAVTTNIEEAVQSAIESVEYIMDIKSLKNRLFTLTSEIDESWPHKEKLQRLANSSLELDERFDKIIIPIFIMHDSELITNYDKSNFLNLFNEKVANCRGLLQAGFDEGVIDLLDLRVFYFPVSDVNEVNGALLEELNS
ncbi:SAVED domain-containing protein [Xenorhabdus bovienii]|uniref:SAVED domain-containing protein n=1 Tax=Xenorhabdus bovienii TaxID=40576 RepID=A0AAJ1JAM4_XENBV|nr:Hachiman antiphage defense system protein HamA [Xenorhabdus bovienii]MDE1480274.1 SAVED domain-containing protein [Xenorhabdus bovienii]MDE1487595.1 SAVED domain-containing protein [Xenorhabdus bovienii]MDE9478472.1 SAVED domain-containing protein [Xenorhabdus bovienii]MDE9511944.1 SAVED domain-containing protein [Xenorhabdus bovienii]MDE9523586.1 SAVED domain-containing protein [Xenorhabdus bovienii]